MKTMRFYLRTGFGESKASYGGTDEERFSGYGQVNVAAGLDFRAMSLLLVNAYLRDGFGAQIYSSYYKQLLLLAAIHWAGQPTCSPSKLIAAVQTATYAWGSLAIATGAAMKP